MGSVRHYIGLTDEQVLESRARHGANVLTPPEKESLWKLFLSKFDDPLIIILMVIGVFAVGVSCYEYWGLHDTYKVFFEPAGIFVAILLATGLGFYFELKAQNEFTVLNQENDHELVTVVRSGNVVEVPKCDIVVGDILVLQTGQEVPADARLLEAVSMSVDESSLTGEPVHHKTTVEAEFDRDATFPSDKVYRGTQVMEGHGYAEVLAVGDKTENGRIMQTLTGAAYDESDDLQGLTDEQRRAIKLNERNKVTQHVKTPLNEQLDGLSRLITNLSYAFAGAIIVGKLLVYFNWALPVWLLLLPTGLFFYLVIKHFHRFRRWQCVAAIAGFFALFIAAMVMLHGMLMPQSEMSDLLAYALETIMIAVTLVVVAVPEGLPMAVSLSLANSMRKMLKTNNLVRKMHACETMGAATVICTDKTGTLTQNQMQVKQCMLARDAVVYEGIAVNSTASLDFSHEIPSVIGNPTEGALLLWLHSNGHDYQLMRQAAKLIQEIPFSTERKYMGTIVESAVLKGQRVLYIKGAPEILLQHCAQMSDGHSRQDYEQALTTYQQKAMRTLGLAYQVIGPDEQVTDKEQVTTERLTFLGVVGIEDPIRDDVTDAVDKCAQAGIDVKIITGDTKETAREIGRQIGVWDDSCTDDQIVTGKELYKMPQQQMLDSIERIKIIARARPMDKKRIVMALQQLGHVVAVTGDGTNDAPALHVAHVGLSMGAGTSVAKEASDITIIDNSFASIARAVKWGRSLFQNIQRFLLFQLTVNVAACFLVLVGAFMGTESPLTVTQMLWVNLIMDTFAAFALSALPPTDKVMSEKPRDRKAFILDRSILANILGVGFFFFFLLLAFLYVFQRADVTQLTDLLHLQLGPKGELTTYELTLLFTIFVMTHYWYMFNARAYKSGGSGLDLKDCEGFASIAILILLGQIAIVQIPYLNNFFNVEPLKLVDWVIIIALSALVVVVREVHAKLKRL